MAFESSAAGCEDTLARAQLTLALFTFGWCCRRHADALKQRHSARVSIRCGPALIPCMFRFGGSYARLSWQKQGYVPKLFPKRRFSCPGILNGPRLRIKKRQ